MLSPPTSPSQRFGAQEKRASIWSKNLSSTRIPLGIYLIIPNGELPGSWLEHEAFPGGEAVDDMENLDIFSTLKQQEKIHLFLRKRSLACRASDFFFDLSLFMRLTSPAAAMGCHYDRNLYILTTINFRSLWPVMSWSTDSVWRIGTCCRMHFGRPDDMHDLGRWKACGRISGDLYAPGDLVL